MNQFLIKINNSLDVTIKKFYHRTSSTIRKFCDNNKKKVKPFVRLVVEIVRF